MPYQVRWLLRCDLPQVLQIEQLLNESAPWTEDELLSCLRERNCIAMVAEGGDRIDGWMIYELLKERLNVIRLEAVERQAAFDMIEKVKWKLSFQRRDRVIFHIRESDLATLYVLRECGVRAMRVNRNFFGDNEDGIELVYRLPETVPREPFEREAVR